MDDVERLKRRLDALSPLTGENVSALMSLWRAQTANYVQASNAIEGNTLTVGETLLVIDEDRVTSNKRMSDHVQALNGARAFGMMLDMAQSNERMTLDTILELHEAVDAGKPHAGKLRDHAVQIRGSLHVPPNFEKVHSLMVETLERFRGTSQTEHPVVRAARLHFDLVTIHPFADGNGRTSRLVQNLALIQNGYPPVLIHGAERGKYFEVLQGSQIKVPGIGDPAEFIDYCIELEVASLEAYVEALDRLGNGETMDSTPSVQTVTKQRDLER